MSFNEYYITLVSNTHLRTCPAIRIISHPASWQGPGQAGVVSKGEVILAPVEGARECRKVSSTYPTHLEENRLKDIKMEDKKRTQKEDTKEDKKEAKKEHKKEDNMYQD